MKQKPFLHLVAVLTILFLSVSSAFAQLQPATLSQIESLLAEKESRTPVQQKISSQLLQAAREFRGQKMVVGVDLEAAMVNADKRGVLKVDISARVTNDLISQIEKIGGKIIYASPQFNSIRAEMNVSKVETVAALKEVKFIIPAVQARTVGNDRSVAGTNPSGKPTVIKTGGGAGMHKTSFAERARRVSDAVEKYLNANKNFAPPAGPVNAQGDRTHRADEVRARYGAAGQGIRIGVLSDSYNALGAAAADVATGELPGPGNPLGNTTPVGVLLDYPGGSDEGRAMLQIVHDLAPKAQLFFASAFVSEANFADNILALRAAPYNCDIIIDDVFYYDEPVFQDGIVAQAVNSVTASAGLYFSSAGNQGSLAKNTSGVWEGDFNDAGSPVFTGSTKAGTIHNFGTMAAPVNGDIIRAAGGPYILKWADPMGASGNDYDLFLISSTGTVKASSTNIQNGSQDPFEGFGAPAFATGDRLVIFKTTAAQRRAINLSTFGGLLTNATTGQTFGHSAAIDAYSVAATPAEAPFASPTPAGPFPGAFTSANQVETFTSDGPRRVFYNADGTPITAGNYLFSTNGGNVRRKPDITAADGVATTLPAGSGLNPFYGTSASAPHAGAVAALVKSSKPSLTPAQIRTILTTTTVDIESPGYDNVSGYGIVQAAQAIEAARPTPLAALELGFVTPLEGSFSNANGVIDPGELGNLLVQLRNFSLVGATNAVATLATTTPGVTILRSTVSYGSIAAENNATNTATPFSFGINRSVPCGTTINFILTVAFGGGAGTQGFQFSFNVGPRLGGTISSVLGSPPAGTASNGFFSFTGTQTGRLNRNGVAAVCGVVDVPLINTATGARAFDAYTYTNTSATTLCITSTLTSANGIDLYQAAYNDSGYVPATPTARYLAGAGVSGTTTSFAFTVAPGRKFTIVVHAVTPGAQVGSAYSLAVNFNLCSASPACNPVVISNNTIANGATGAPYAQLFTATGGSNSGTYNFQIRGNLPAGLIFNGNSLSGTPTQAGLFSIAVIASDPAGCVSDTNTYTLQIAGTPPASVAATFGTPQQSFPTTQFSQLLQATVKDAGGNPLPGVKVVFAAPLIGATGTFASTRTAFDTVITNSNGVAISSAFTANALTGSYVVSANVNGIASASFNLTNFCPASFIVTSSADSGPGSLRSILSYACPGVNITFDQSVNFINLTSGELPIVRAVNIIGPGAGKLTISGNGSSRIFNISAGTAAAVNIQGLTLTNGMPDDSQVLGGGGILVLSGTVNVLACVISNSDASLTFFGEGGAIDNEGGTVLVNRCAILNNRSSADGGGITNYSGSMTISNSTIAGNSAGTLGVGGGIYVNTTLSMVNTTVYGNTAQFGGNIYRDLGTLTTRNSVIGGGVLIGSGGTAPDISGAVTSNDYNLIENPTGATITGVTAHNVTGVRANLLPVGNYGGDLPSLLPRSNSIVINNGDSLLTAGIDQRGYPRLIGRRADMGAVEANYALVATQGTPQSTMVTRPFPLQLQARVTETSLPIAGDTVFFRAPTTGASGTFPGSLLNTAAVSNLFGLATAPVFTANGITGTYNVSAILGPEFPALNYTLTNTAASAAATDRSAASSQALETLTMSAYPNPVRDKLIVQTGGNAKQILTVFDVLGHQMIKMSVSGGRHEINAKDWAKGLYILTVTEGGKTKFTTKFVKD